MNCRSSGSYGHRIRLTMPQCYRLSWTVDLYYSGSRLRYPHLYTRDTDERGAKRFAKRWGIEFNFEKEEP